MASQSRPVRLAVLCFALVVLSPVLTMIAATLSFFTPVRGLPYLSLLQQVIPSLITWGVCCWTAAQTKLSLRSWIVVGILMILLILLRIPWTIPVPGLYVFILYQYLCGICYDLVCLFVLTRAFGISLGPIEIENSRPHSQLSISHVLISGTIVAATVALGHWIHMQSNGAIGGVENEQFETLNQMFQMLSAASGAALFGGAIWWLYSPRRAWLGWIGLFIWLATRFGTIAANYLMVDVDMANTASIWGQLLGWQLIDLVSILAVIPLFKMFGYRFVVQTRTGSLEPTGHDKRSPFDEPDSMTSACAKQ